MASPETQAPARSQSSGGWLKTLRAEVQPTTFNKGREYAESRRVTLLAQEPSRVAASVVGSEGVKYDVEVSQGTEAAIDSRCSCDSWNKEGPHCQHVVAAALVYLARTRQAAAAAAAPAAPVSEETTDPSSEDEAPSPAGTPLLPGLAKIEGWLGLSSLPDYDYLYRLTPATGANANRQWVLDVRRTDAQAKGPVQVKRVLTSGTRLAPTDERIFLELARFESRFDARIVVSDEELADLLESLRHRRIIYRGTALEFSPEPARPQIQLDSKADGAMARIDVLLPTGKEVFLKDAIVLAGKRTWILVGQGVYRLEPELPPRLLRKWLLEPTMAFPPTQIDRVLTFFAAHLPRFRMLLKADGVDVDESVTPQFVFTLEGGPDQVTGQLAAKYEQSTSPVSPSALHLGYASGPSPDGKSRKLYRRDAETERKAGKLLLEKGFRFDANAGTYSASGDTALEFWADGEKALPPDWKVFVAKRPDVRVRPKLRPRVRISMSGVNWFDLEAEFVTDDLSVDLGAVRMWLDSGRKYIPLKDGSFAEADVNELRRAADLLEEAGALPGKKTTRLPLYQAVALELLGDLGEFSEVDAKAKKAMETLHLAGELPTTTPPDGLVGTLRHYQESGLSWMWFLHRHGLSGILADDMGLGKTLQALSMLLKVKNEEGPKPSLVVAPTSVLANWEREAERFTPALSVFVWHGQDRKEGAGQLKSVDLVLTSYALVRRDEKELATVGFRYLILDEAQNIKNADSATAQACKAIPCDQRMALTGTPLENRLSELWSIFDFLMPGFLGSHSAFGERYEQPIQLQAEPEARDRLRKRIRPFILRRLKTEVAKELPPKTESVAYCEMEPAQATLYREVLEQSRRKVYDTIDKVGFGKSRVSILAALMRLRQVCCDPRLLKLPPGTVLPPSAKLARFEALVDDLIAEGHRALVFSQFTEMLDLLKDRFDGLKIPYLWLDGRTKDRMSRVDQFNDPNGPPIFFISLKAGGTGLNLTAADYVIHYDPWWNPAVEDQATDRTHRIGQTKAVISYKLITKGTVEEKILALQKRKRDLAAGVLGVDAELAKTLTERDVQDLFEAAE